MLIIENLSYKYPDNHQALNNISFNVNEHEKIALVGANGSGKSTLLLHLAGALPVQSGKVLFDNKYSQEILRQNIALTFQDPDDQLLMPSVIEDVAFSFAAKGMNQNQAHKNALNILESLGISHLAHRLPHKLSGGEKRIVSFAGVLASNPKILALDEPSAALDPRARRRVIDFLRDSNKTIILATHDLDMALDICSRALILNSGMIVCEGKLPELFKNEEILYNNGLELPLRFQ